MSVICTCTCIYSVLMQTFSTNQDVCFASTAKSDRCSSTARTNETSTTDYCRTRKCPICAATGENQLKCTIIRLYTIIYLKIIPKILIRVYYEILAGPRSSTCLSGLVLDRA